MKKIIMTLILILTLLAVLHLIGTGFLMRNDVVLHDYSVSEDGTEITLYTSVLSSMGYTRGFKDNGGGVKPHYLTFYSTFGGLNSVFGAKNEFVLQLDKNDTEIYFAGIDGGYRLVLKKNEEMGVWERP